MSLVLGFFSLLSLMFGGEEALQEKYADYEPPNRPTTNAPMINYEINENVPLSEDEILLERTLKFKNGEGMRPTELPTGYENFSKEFLMNCLPTRTCSGG